MKLHSAKLIGQLMNTSLVTIQIRSLLPFVQLDITGEATIRTLISGILYEPPKYYEILI